MEEKTAKKRQRLPGNERKKQLIDAARKVFVRLGMNGTRIRDLAEEAGVNEATFFLYFKTKQEIFEAAIIEPLASLLKLPLSKGSEFAEANDPELKASICTEINKEILLAMTELYPLLITAQFSDQETGAEIYKNDIYPMIKEIGRSAKIGFNLKSKDYSEFVALATFGLSFAMVMHDHFLGKKLNANLIAKRIANLLLRGVGE